MAKFVIKAGSVDIDGNELADHVRQVAVQMDKDKQDATGLNGNGVKEEIPGLSTEGFEIEFSTDPSAGSVDSVLFPLYRNESVFVVAVRVDTPDGAGKTYSARCRLFSFHPVDGQVGQLSTTKVPFGAIEPIVEA
jgi:hypothetical protein